MSLNLTLVLLLLGTSAALDLTDVFNECWSDSMKSCTLLGDSCTCKDQSNRIRQETRLIAAKEPEYEERIPCDRCASSDFLYNKAASMGIDVVRDIQEPESFVDPYVVNLRRYAGSDRMFSVGRLGESLGDVMTLCCSTKGCCPTPMTMIFYQLDDLHQQQLIDAVFVNAVWYSFYELFTDTNAVQVATDLESADDIVVHHHGFSSAKCHMPSLAIFSPKQLKSHEATFTAYGYGRNRIHDPEGLINLIYRNEIKAGTTREAAILETKKILKMEIKQEITIRKPYFWDLEAEFKVAQEYITTDNYFNLMDKIRSKTVRGSDIITTSEVVYAHVINSADIVKSLSTRLGAKFKGKSILLAICNDGDDKSFDLPSSLSLAGSTTNTDNLVVYKTQGKSNTVADMVFVYNKRSKWLGLKDYICLKAT